MLAALAGAAERRGPALALRGGGAALSLLLARAPSLALARRWLAGDSHRHSAVYVTDAEGSVASHTPLLLGLMNYFERHLPFVGYFAPIGGSANPDTGDHPLDRHLRLVHDTFELKYETRLMQGVAEEEAVRLVAAGRRGELLDRIYASFVAYKEMHDMVIVHGTAIGSGKLDAEIASALESPALITAQAKDASITDIARRTLLKKALLDEHKVPVLGAVLNKVPAADLAIVTAQLRRKFADAGLPLLGALPEDRLLRGVRLDEVLPALPAEFQFGRKVQLDQEYTAVYVAAQRLEELLELLATDGDTRPLVITTRDRLDIVLGLLASQVSVAGPNVAGIVLARSGPGNGRNQAQAMLGRMFEGLSKGYQGSLLPIMSTDLPIYEAVRRLDHLTGAVLPTSTRKIQHCKAMFDKHVDANSLVAGIEAEEAQITSAARVTPKMFAHSIKTKCAAHPQHIVLPEALDPRVLKAASEVTTRGLARITLLGDPAAVAAEAKKLGADISACAVVEPKSFGGLDKYVAMLLEARKGKNLTPEAARDAVANDPNMFGVMMVASGDAAGMVSGAIHTTAATIRPAMQVLRTPNLVSSVFFMCLPDKVLVYGDCAVNVAPSAADLASIAACSADTAAAFGIEPRVAMLSYSTMGSGAGPDVQKVTDAVAAVQAARPDLMVEGPLQYDAAIDPAVASVKIKTPSAVAGRATVFVFPDLNTGNNTYKAVQQATGAVAMGPVMQGLRKPVNDLSRGCTVADIVNTICVTGVQAMQAAAATAVASKRASERGGAAAEMGIFYSCPREETVAMVESFGRFKRMAYPGCNCLNPCLGESVAGVVSLRVNQLDVKCETKSRDNVFVTVVVSVQYQVSRGQEFDAFYRLTDSTSQISSYVFDVVRACVPKMNLDDVFLEKEAIARSIRQELTKSMASYGFEIKQALVNDIQPAHKVKEAMSEINAAARLRVAAMEKAEAAKVRVVKEAEAEAEAKYLQGAGVARQRQAIVAGLQTSVREFKESVTGVAAHDVLELMLVTQYFDTLKEVGANNKVNVVFTPSPTGGADQLLAQLRGSALEAGAVQTMERA
ncbi:pta [Scenedesmus sp. PABB004]|nr:pta [Scenedesmus sp. PABB004]